MLAAFTVGSLVWVLFWVVVAALFFYFGNWFIAYVQLGAPFDKLARVIVAVIAFLFLINALLMLVGRPFINLGSY